MPLYRADGIRASFAALEKGWEASNICTVSRRGLRRYPSVYSMPSSDSIANVFPRVWQFLSSAPGDHRPALPFAEGFK